MSFKAVLKNSILTLSFERRVLKSISDDLITCEGKACKVDSPFESGEPLEGFIENVYRSPSDGVYIYMEWNVVVNIDTSALEDTELNPNWSYVINGKMGSCFNFVRSFKMSLVSNTRYEAFENYDLPPINKASVDWDHVQSVDRLLFERKDSVFVNRKFIEHPCGEKSLDGCSILIPTSDVKSNGRRNYTEIALADDGWTYSGDIGCDSFFPEFSSVKQAMEVVRSAVVCAAHNP
jgi:hypothetical protein